jgi:hypothetical protein
MVFMFSLALFIFGTEAFSATKTEILRPTANAGTATNPTYAYDASTATSADVNYGSSATPKYQVTTWQTHMAGYKTLTLKVLYSAQAAANDTYRITYSTDGGSTWPTGNDLVAATGSAATNVTVSATLSPSQNFSQLRVGVISNKTMGGDNKLVYVFDVWTEGTYDTKVYTID